MADGRMDGERWKRVEELFVEASKRAPGEREAFLDRECGGDRELRAEVASLLANDLDEGGSLTEAVQGAAAGATADLDARHLDRRIGAYRVVRELGHGGMGIVFLACRDDEAYRQQVAIKLLRFGGDRDSVVRRFKSERQILATLDHPNIARLMDGGTTSSGEPYVVMEFVEGQPIDVYCDAERLTTEERLSLFLDVCAALQYAHDRSIVHRDIKPGNILVGEGGAPKLLDFGIAKLLDPGAIASSLADTGTSTRLMTPEYASPEQIRGEPVTPRTDVYALGLLLYELLAGRHPYRSQALHPAQLARLICDEEPPRPSNTVTVPVEADDMAPVEAIGSARRTVPSRLRRRLAGDLDTIVLTALRKEPERRYGSVREMAEDIRRHLDGEPILARPTSMTYRVGKLVRRKPAHVALLLTLALGLPVLGLLGAQALRQQRAEQRAEVAALLDEARWLEGRDRSEEVLARTGKILDIDPGHALAFRHRAWARYRLSTLTSDDGEASRLERLALEDAEAAIRSEPDASWPHALHAILLERLGRAKEAARAEERAGERSGVSVEELDFAARLAMSDGDPQQAVELYTDLLLHHPDQTAARISLAYAYERLGDAEAALREYRVANGLVPDQDLVYIDMGRITMNQGDLEGATRYLERALELDPGQAIAHENMGELLLQKGLRAADVDQAAALFDGAVESFRRGLELNPRLPWAEVSLASTLIHRSGLEAEPDLDAVGQALEHYDNVLRRWPSLPERGHERAAYSTALASRCDVLIRLGRLEDALETCRRVTRVFPDDALGFYNLAGVHAKLGSADEAIAALERDLELGDTDWEYLRDDAWFERLRDDPRFVSLLRRMKEAAGR